MPARKTKIANALIKCIIFILMLLGLFGSFFLKKYIKQMYEIKKGSRHKVATLF